MALRQVQVGNVVRWLRGAQGKNLGVVTHREGNRATIRLDIGEEFTFALPTDVLDAVEFEPGSQVTVTSDGSHGMVTGSFEGPDAMRFYRIAYADGTEKVAPEPSLRPAKIVNPITLAKSGEFGAASATTSPLLTPSAESPAAVRLTPSCSWSYVSTRPLAESTSAGCPRRRGAVPSTKSVSDWLGISTSG